MTSISLPFGSRLAVRILSAAAAASLLAGCADSERFTNPFSNPFQQANQATDPAPTGSLSPAAAAPVAPVASRPLSPQAQMRPVAATAPVAPVKTAMPQSASRPASPGPAGWSIAGGSPVTVAQGENARILSDRYGVPVEALVHTNGLTSAAQIQPGTHLVVPVYNAALAASGGARVAVEPPHPVPLRTEHAHAEPVKTPVPIAQAKTLQIAKSKESLKDQLKAAKKGPGAPPANLREPKSPEPKPAAAIHTAKAPLAKPSASLSAKPEESKKLAVKTSPIQEKPLAAEKPSAKVKEAKLQEAKPQEAPKPQAPKAEPAPQTAAAPETEKPSDSANPEFRWPARGRIIQGFKSGGNDGINIAVPEGTAVKAAEGGVVAYAGNELKGYGNLVLIRHPNGYVTAYANNADLEVKRGETVKRGQVIAKSGQTGNVASPQLHFELRKGATPVDPTQFLAGL